MIIIPANFPDFQTGLAIEEQGAGIVLKRRPINGDELIHAIAHICKHYEEYRTATHRIKEEMLQLWHRDGASSIVDLCYKVKSIKE